jgi:hypothetical protein
MKDRTASGWCSTTGRDSLYVPFRDIGLRECANVCTPNARSRETDLLTYQLRGTFPAKKGSSLCLLIRSLEAG